MTTPVYSQDFYSYTEQLNTASARRVVPLLRSMVRLGSAFDVGCATGHWLRAWAEAGVSDIMGADGATVDRGALLFDSDRFVTANLASSLDLGRRFDLVQSLEVAEHLPAASAETFIDNLVRHGDVIFFSAAPPGQGGKHHVNERPYDYWRDLFAARGYALFDALRPILKEYRDVAPWYRYNMLLFANAAGQARLSPEAAAMRLPERSPVADVSPLPFRLRKLAVALLPQGIQDIIADAIAARHRR